MADERPRKTDSTPDSQARRYRARGGEQSSGAFTDIDDRLNRLEDQRSTPAPSRGLSLQRPQNVPTITGPLLAELIVISADDIFANHRAPLPSRLLAVLAIFGALGLAKGNAARPAQAFGWALVVSSLYAVTAPNTTSGALRGLAAVGNFLSGKTPVTSPTKKAST